VEGRVNNISAIKDETYLGIVIFARIYLFIEFVIVGFSKITTCGYPRT
jgi:hypothetical protein